METPIKHSVILLLLISTVNLAQGYTSETTCNADKKVMEDLNYLNKGGVYGHPNACLNSAKVNNIRIFCMAGAWYDWRTPPSGSLPGCRLERCHGNFNMANNDVWTGQTLYWKPGNPWQTLTGNNYFWYSNQCMKTPNATTTHN